MSSDLIYLTQLYLICFNKLTSGNFFGILIYCAQLLFANCLKRVYAKV